MVTNISYYWSKVVSNGQCRSANGVADRCCCVLCLADSECDLELISSPTLRNGTVMSPRYPSVYPADVECHIILRPRTDAGERVQIVFVDFDLNYPIGNPRDPHEYVDYNV